MAVDIMEPTKKALKPTHATVPQLLELAKQDSDTVSCFVDGTNWGDAQGAILVVPDGFAAKMIYDLLAAHGCVTPGKPVTPNGDVSRPSEAKPGCKA